MKKMLSAKFRKFFVIVMAFVLGVCKGGVVYAQSDIKTLDYGILEYTDESGNIIRQYDSGSVVQTYSRELHDDSWVKEMLLTMGMRSEVIDSLSQDDLELYAGSGRMYSTETYYRVDENGNNEIVSEETVTQFLSGKARTPGQTFTGQYTDEYIQVFHTAWVSEDGNTIKHSTTASWINMPTFRYTDSLGSCTQKCSVRPETIEGYYSYNSKTGNTIRVDFVGTDEEGTYTPETDFELVTDGNYTGIGVTFPMPDSTALDFYVHMEYEASPIRVPIGEEISVAVSYCHTVLRVGWDASLSLNSDLSITPQFSLSNHIKPILFTITV